jgi:hypothetical protein
MKNMAVLNENNVIINIVCCNDDEEQTSNLIEYGSEDIVIIGGDYFENVFYPPRPYLSWNRNNKEWVAPIPKPDDRSIIWDWDETNQEWKPFI